MNAPMPNQIVTVSNGQAVTTTLAIADGTDTQHKNVMELVRNYLADLEEFGRVAFETRPFETAGGTQKREIAILNEQQSTLLLTLMRNSEIVVRFKVRLVKAFFELQQAAKPIDPIAALSDPATMRGLLLTYTEKVLSLESTVAEQAPKVEAFDRISASPDAVTVTQAAKLLGVKRADLTARLHAEGWWYRQNNSWVAYDKFIKNGCLQYKEANYTDENTGMNCVKPYCHITPKGLARLALMLGVQLPANDYRMAIPA